jgi:hypothetical protein
METEVYNTAAISTLIHFLKMGGYMMLGCLVFLSYLISEPSSVDVCLGLIVELHMPLYVTVKRHIHLFSANLTFI